MWLEHQNADTDTICLHLMIESASAAVCPLAKFDAVCVVPPPAVFVGNEGFAACLPSQGKRRQSVHTCRLQQPAQQSQDIRLHLGQHIYFANNKLVRSWAKFVCRAATEGINNIWDLLTSLAQPPAATMDYLEYLVATIQSLLGPLPVTDRSLQEQPESYLPWLHLVLLDFHDVQGAPHAPKLFTMLPQSSNHTHFITISSASLHK